MSAVSDLTPGTWNIDSAHSSIGFTARHLMITKVRGRFGAVTGSLEVPADPTQTTVNATIEMGSVDTSDAGRDEHLRSADFFDVENHPTMTFVSTALRGDATGSEFVLVGDLTIKGVTKSVELDLEFGNQPLAALGLRATTPRAERRASLLRGSARSAGPLPAKSAAVKRESRRQASSSVWPGGGEEGWGEEDGAFPFSSSSPPSAATRKGAKASSSSCSRAERGEGEEGEAAAATTAAAAASRVGKVVRREGGGGGRREGRRGRGDDDDGDDNEEIGVDAPAALLALAVVGAAVPRESIR